MLTYNRALSVYAKKSHRQDIDALFLQIDNLRNIIRRNILGTENDHKRTAY